MRKHKRVYSACIAAGAFLVLCASIYFAIAAPKSSAESLDNNDRVSENSLLRYHLIVKYDGVDRSGNISSDSTIVKIIGNEITVTDRIPDGLTFEGFETTSSGIIGAVAREGDAPCSGIVINDSEETIAGDDSRIIAGDDHGANYFPGNDYNGMHYDPTTRTVTFRINELQAGCKLVTGIVTKTPTLAPAQQRMDFYNIASAQEALLSTSSNTVHAWIGQDIAATTYAVNYRYTGSIPTLAPKAPERQKYAPNAIVNLAPEPNIPGYTFSGWTVDGSNATIENGAFVMPESDVFLYGTFTAIPTPTTYTVSYEIDGDTPEGYVAPVTKSYEAGDVVTVQTTPSESILEDYTFSDWSSTDVAFSDEGEFEMPEKNVVIHGSFAKKTYTLSYEFEGAILPPNADELLPASSTYTKGETITTAAKPEADGYRFIGWYYPTTFEMPNSDVVIKGEWMIENGTFEPEISMEIVDPKEYFVKDDTVLFKIIVENTADFEIQNVQLLEELDGVKFVTGDGYTVNSDTRATIPSIAPGSSVTLYAEFPVTENKDAHFVNVATITSAEAVDRPGYNLNPDVDYEATAEFDTKRTEEVEPTPETPKTGSNPIPTITIAVISLVGIAIPIKLVTDKIKR